MRKAKPKKRILLPDPKFNDPYVTRFINNLMFSGKKTVAFRIFYDSTKEEDPLTGPEIQRSVRYPVHQ